MKKIAEEIVINASRDRVWECVVNKELYEAWAKAFEEGSTFVGNWEEGSEMMFVMFDEEGKRQGMLSEIAQNRRPEFMSIHHVGSVSGDEKTRGGDWAGAYENYTLSEVDDGTKFVLEMDVVDEYAEMMSEMWKRGLVELKRVAEE